ncbi:BPI fold-containing family C protein-like [Hyperolius riggenbachi]|uniref:BPI fold-containing family C protein-like n=1 Tax=Hyperolius riggenbachi TaxID=752182 RepID=UPI0035A28ED0
MFGQVTYSISSIIVEEFNISSCEAIPVPPTDVDVIARGVNAKVHGHLDVKHWLIKDSVTFNLALWDISSSGTLATFKDPSGRPAVILSACQSEVVKAKLHLSGGASWFYNLFTFLLEKPIRDNLNRKLCPRINEVIKILQKELSTFQVTADLGGNGQMDYSLISRPHVQKTYIDLDIKGTIQHFGIEEEQDSNLDPIRLPDLQSSMVLVGMSEYFFNNIGKSYFMSDILKFTITQQQYPHVFWLKTGDYGSIIPEMSDFYPASQAMILRLKATKPPVINLTSQLSMEMEGLLQASVVLPYLITKEAYSANVKATFYADSLHLVNLKMIVSFALQSFQISEFKSEVGPVNVALLTESLGQSLKESLLLTINNALRGGIPMPTLANVTVEESEVRIIPGCLWASLEMYYIPWKELLNVLPYHRT